MTEPSLQNPLYIISSPTVRLLIRAVLEFDSVWEDETVQVELVNFVSVLRAELQHRGDFTE